MVAWPILSGSFKTFYHKFSNIWWFVIFQKQYSGNCQHCRAMLKRCLATSFMKPKVSIWINTNHKEEGKHAFDITTTIRDEQYLSWNIAKAIYCIIWKYCIWSNIQKYRDILTIFVMYDFGHFWPEIDLKTIATHQFSCILACNLLNSWNCIKFLSVCDESTVQKSGKWKA